ncbi:hypothetical protein HGK72_26695 [Mycolicibacterium fortuitum]|uniref:hypothetical protein n=1 Tax=Mycolicibacterium fortuitum TaxID=1766 RepID=UPI00148F7219|nr:hypothetical protein [Mycolicibacterium fortuitum]
MKVETTLDDNGRRTIRAVDDRGILAFAIEFPDPDPYLSGTYWTLGSAFGPTTGYPSLDSEQAARDWVGFIGGLMESKPLARPVPVWCPNDHRQVVADAAQHQTERGLRLVSGGAE